MTEHRIAPANCANMEHVRAGVDALDRALATLIAERFRYMDAAARIKSTRDAVRDEARKAEVIARARANAEREGFPGEVAAALWEQLVEASIAYEFERWDESRA